MNAADRTDPTDRTDGHRPTATGTFEPNARRPYAVVSAVASAVLVASALAPGAGAAADAPSSDSLAHAAARMPAQQDTDDTDTGTENDTGTEPAPSGGPGAPPIERGDRDMLVAWWQERLNTWLSLSASERSGSDVGPLVVDGWFGPNTEAATVVFQEATQEREAFPTVPVDGVVDPEDRVALREAIEALEVDPGAPPIERGDRDVLVAWWQERLNTWLSLSGSERSGSDVGPLVVDGWFGPNTEAATVVFQEATQEREAFPTVPVDGVVDPEDRVALREAIEALEADPGAPPIERGDRDMLVAWWQERLNTWLSLSGSDVGPLVVDGWFGPNTEAATVVFQESVGSVPVDGVVDPEDRVALREAIEALESGGDGDQGDEPDDGGAVGELATEPRSVAATLDSTAGLADVTTSVTADLVRVGFVPATRDDADDAGAIAAGLGYDVRYVDEVPVAASGRAPVVSGDAYLQVQLRPISRFRPGEPGSGDEGEQTYDGPERILVPDAQITEVVLVDDHEGVLTWVIGLPAPVPFAVGVAPDGALAVDVER